MGAWLRVNPSVQWMLVLILAVLPGGTTAGPCCPDDNLLVFPERRCSSNAEENSFFGDSTTLNCSGFHFNVHLVGTYSLDHSDGTLSVGAAVKYTIPPGKYCITTLIGVNDSISQENAAIICSPEEFTSLELSTEMELYCVCTLISAILLFITFIVYLLVPELRDLQGKCLMCTMLCLCFAYTTVGFFLLSFFTRDYCAHQALFTYFWTLASFFWMNVVSFDIWRKTLFRRFPVSDKHLLLIYNFFGWGFPLTFLVVAAATHMSRDEDDLLNMCWFDGPTNLLLYFAIPVIVLTFLNTLYFVWASCRLWSGKDESQAANKIRRLRYKLLLYLKMFLLMGIPWVVRILVALLTTNKVYWVVMNVAVMLQGLFMFIILVLFRKRALRGLVKRFQCQCCPRSWIAGEDQEASEAVLQEELELRL